MFFVITATFNVFYFTEVSWENTELFFYLPPKFGHKRNKDIRFRVTVQPFVLPYWPYFVTIAEMLKLTEAVFYFVKAGTDHRAIG